MNKKTVRDYMDRVTVMFERYPCPEDQYRVQFSDKVHFGYSTKDKLRIIRKSGMRYYQNCIEEVQEPIEKDKKRYHCQVAVGHNFKFNIYFQKIPGNTNGKMSQQVYINKILEPVVKPWLQAHHNFVVEKDGDLGQRLGKSNTVHSWKEQNNLGTYFNCHNSLDLALLENCWQPVK